MDDQIAFTEYKFKPNDTIEGVLIGKSNLPLKIAKSLFFSINSKKTYKAGSKVLIPFSKISTMEDQK